MCCTVVHVEPPELKDERSQAAQRWTCFSFNIRHWKWLCDDTLLCVCVRMAGGYVCWYPEVCLQQLLCYWLSALIFIVSDSPTISYRPASWAASMRRLCCQDAFTVKTLTLKLKLPKGKVCGTLAGKTKTVTVQYSIWSLSCSKNTNT